MTKFTRYTTAATILLMSAPVALAGPCDTGSIKGKSPNTHVDTKSSDVDESTKNVAGGQQPPSPGTVGAMNNVGNAQGAKMAENKGSADKKEEPGSKNLAGGNQPASPGTVGAMNKTVPDQNLAKSGEKNDDC